MSKSTHRVEVVPVSLRKHPNADRLSIVDVFGFTCVVATDQWQGITHAAYIPPDSIVDTSRAEFGFLAEQGPKVRIKAKKLRGVLSFGLLIPAPVGSREGDDLADQLGVTHYEPALKNECSRGVYMGGECASAPNVYTVKYDLDAGRRYAHKHFTTGETVCVSEKIHGANARYVFWDGKMHCGSRTEWKREYPDYSHLTLEHLMQNMTEERAKEVLDRIHSKKPSRNMWWQVLDTTPSIIKFCEANPGHVLYGEAYGAVQDLNYGCGRGEVRFAAFDVMADQRWLDFEPFYDLMSRHDVPTVPLFEPMPYDFDKICELAEGKTLMPGADHVREGVVVQPIINRFTDCNERVKFKWVGAGYLEKSK